MVTGPGGLAPGLPTGGIDPAATRRNQAGLLGAKAAGTNGSGEELMPEGMIDFRGADLNQVLEIYSMLVNRTLLRPATLPAPIMLKTQGQLTMQEGIQALEAVLALNGMTMVNVGDKFVKVMAEAQGDTPAAPFGTNTAAQLPEMGQYVTHIVQLKYSKPSELVPVLQAVSEDTQRHPADGGQPDLGAAGLCGEREADAGDGEQDRRGGAVGICAGGDSDQVWEGGGHRRGVEQLEQAAAGARAWAGARAAGADGLADGRGRRGQNRTGTTGGYPGTTTPGMVTPPGSAGAPG